MRILSLQEMTSGEAGVIHKIASVGPVMQRLAEMGFTPGTRISVIRFAPLGDPMEVEIRGYRLSIRKTEAALIQVAMGGEL